MSKIKYFLVITALAFTVPDAAKSAPAPDCAALGYTMTAKDCVAGLPIVKCPSDNSKVFCTKADIPATVPCTVGTVLFSDKTCGEETIPGKTAIGVVFDADNKLAISVGEQSVPWAIEASDIEGLKNLSVYSARKDMDGKKNTETILAACPRCVAAVIASRIGGNEGDYFLPSAGQLMVLAQNLKEIQKTMLKINTDIVIGAAYSAGLCWSSTENSADKAIALDLYTKNLIVLDKSSGIAPVDHPNMVVSVRPAIAF